MSTHNGYVKEFPFVRIDCFSSTPNPATCLHPLYHFLTHAHTDHLVGLNSPAFRGVIYMTPVTRTLVANTMEAAERVRWQEFGGHRVKKPQRKFENLFRVKAGTHANASATNGGGTPLGRGMDQIREIHLNQPIKLRGPNDGDWVKVTAIDANHCLGSCMYLFEGVVDGTWRSCLVTGDLRAEPWYLSSLLHNPLLAQYTIRPAWSHKGKETARSSSRPICELDCIYLDTSNLLLDEELVTKECAIDDVIELMRLYPEDTRFFLNAWTWGYEDLLKGIYKAFGAELIHLDWYKHRIYTAPSIQHSDPLLATLGSLSPFSDDASESFAQNNNDPSPSLHIRNPPQSDPPVSSTKGNTSSRKTSLRFHACERYWKCDEVWQDGRGCYTWTEEYLALRRAALHPKPQDKKLVKPGSGEYLRSDGTVGIRGDGACDHNEAGQVPGRVVYVNPVEMMKWKWDEYRAATERKIKRARKTFVGLECEGDDEFPNSLLIPLARHSTLPELQRFVSIFRPKTLYPLTISTADLRHPARDYLSMSSLFSSCLAPEGPTRLDREAKQYVQAWKVQRGIFTTSSPEHDSCEDPGNGLMWLGEGAWEREMRKRGLNVEGGKVVVEEVLRWATVEPKPVPKNGGVQNMEEVMKPAVEPSRSCVAVHRQLTYGQSSSRTSSTDSPAPLNALDSTAGQLLPPPLDFSERSRHHIPPTCPTQGLGYRSIGRALQKSVTFAPSPTKSPEVALTASPTSPLKRTRSLPITSATPTDDTAALPTSYVSKSTFPAPDERENTRLPRAPDSIQRRVRRLRREQTHAEQQEEHARLVLALQRTLQGKIGPGGRIIPFTAQEREVLKRRERRLRGGKRREKGEGGQEKPERVEGESPVTNQFETVGSSY